MKNEKEPVHCSPKTSAATSLSLTKQNTTDKNIELQPVKNAAKVDQPTLCNQEVQDKKYYSHTNTFTGSRITRRVVHCCEGKKTKEITTQNEEEPPPIPPQGVEQLYTAVNKKTQSTAANDEVESPPIPPHTVE